MFDPTVIRLCSAVITILAIVIASVPFGAKSYASVILTVPPEPLVAFDPSEPPVELDIDGDNTVDFVIPGGSTQINVITQANNRALSFDQSGTLYAADLAEGSFIGGTPGLDMVWGTGSLVMSGCFSGGGELFCRGNFLGGIEYLGVEFDIAGSTHYGWVEIESREFFQFVRIHRWAYESEPGVGLRAGRIPEPSAISLLLVALALASRRTRSLPLRGRRARS